jgi:hypothetical protein
MVGTEDEDGGGTLVVLEEACGPDVERGGTMAPVSILRSTMRRRACPDPGG